MRELMFEAPGPRSPALAGAGTALRLRVRGPYRGFSGYDHHTRAFVRALARHGVALEIEHLDGWGRWLPDGERDPWLERLAGRAVEPEVALHFTMPHQVRFDPGLRHANYTMFEADRVPGHWVEIGRRTDRVIVPTRAAFAAWVDSGVPAERVRIAPLGVDADRFTPAAPPLPFPLPDGGRVAERKHRFLNIGELRPRKNQLALLRAWLRGTRPDDDAVLIMKLGVFQPRAITQFQQDLEAMLRRCGLRFEDAAPVLFLPDVLPEAAMPSLYTAATHYISMSCGEGWDLPMMEAGAAGLQLIAPRHSAYVDYLDEGIAHFIPAAVRPAVFEGSMAAEDRVFFEGMNWWVPDEAEAERIIRAVIAGTRTPTRSARPVFRERFTWAHAARRLAELLIELRDG